MTFKNNLWAVVFFYEIAPFSNHMKQIHLATDEAKYKQYDIQSIHDCDWSNPEAFLDILILTHDHQSLSLAKQRVRGDKGIQSASTLCS